VSWLDDITLQVRTLQREVDKESGIFGIGRENREQRSDPDVENDELLSSPNLGTWGAVADDEEFEDDFCEEDDDEDDAGFHVPRSANITLRPRDSSFSFSPLTNDTEFRSSYVGSDNGFENHLGAELIRRYQAEPSQTNLEYAMSHFKSGLIDPMVKKLSRKPIPEPAVRGATYLEFKKALGKFDPDKGMAFHNFFRQNGSSDLRRWSHSYSQILKPMVSHQSRTDAARLFLEQFRVENDREPTTDELAKELGIPVKAAANIVNQMQDVWRTSRVLRSDYAISHDDLYRRAVQQVHSQLSGKDRSVYEDLFDVYFHGKPMQWNNSVIAKRNGVSNSTVTRMKNRFKELIQQQVNMS